MVNKAVELVEDTVVTLPGVVEVADLRTDEWSGPLASSRAEVIPLTSKLYDLGEVRDETKLEHEKLLKKLHPDAKTSEELIVAEHDGGSSRYHAKLRSIRGIVKAADERNTGHADTLTQLRLSCKKGRNLKSISPTMVVSQKGLQVGELESALQANKFELGTFPDLASENSTLREEAS